MLATTLWIAILVAQVPIDEPRLVRGLQTGTPAERSEILRVIRNVPPNERSVNLVRALADELVRLNNVIAARSRGDLVVSNDVPDEEYLPELIRLNAESSDPLVIPGLVGALGTGNMAIRAVARFGTKAVEQLRVVLSDQAADSMVRDGAAAALLEVIKSDANWGAGQRAQLVQQVRALLARPEPFVVVAALVPLAAQLGDKELLNTVTRIAEDPNAALITDADPRDRLNIQLRAKRALTQH